MKIPGVGPDIEQALQHFVSLTVIHNVYPLLLALVGIAAIASAVHKPERWKILLFIGCGLLLGHFEFMKHIMEPLLEQTHVTLQTETPNYRYLWIIDKSLTRVIPLSLVIGGLVSLVLSGLTWHKERDIAKDDNLK